MTNLKICDDSPPIDFSEWNFGFDKRLDSILADAVSEATANTFSDPDETDVRADDEDLTRFVLDLPFGKDAPVSFEFSVVDAILDSLRWVDDPQVALKARDKFLEIAALLHKIAIPKQEIPRFDLDSVELPSIYRSSLTLNQLWNWDSYSPVDKICEALEADIEEAKAAIARLTEKKLLLETALTHYRKLAADQPIPEAS